MAGSKKVDAVFRALANARRRRIIEMLRRDARSAWQVAKAFDCTWPAISRHLRILRAAGLVRVYSDLEGADRAMYVLEDDALALARKWLDEVGPD